MITGPPNFSSKSFSISSITSRVMRILSGSVVKVRDQRSLCLNAIKYSRISPSWKLYCEQYTKSQYRFSRNYSRRLWIPDGGVLGGGGRLF